LPEHPSVRCRDQHGDAAVPIRKDCALTGGLLEEIYAGGFLRYAAAEEEEWCAQGRPEMRRLRLSTVLIGGGEGGLPTRESVRAMVLGLQRAQRALSGDPGFVELQVVEILEHRAIDA
jgi:hypothetical protein